MKRFLFWFLVIMILAGLFSARHSRRVERERREIHNLDAELRTVDRSIHDTTRASDRVQVEIRQAIKTANQEVREALKEASSDLREALADARESLKEAMEEIHEEVRQSTGESIAGGAPGVAVLAAVHISEPPALPEPPLPPEPLQAEAEEGQNDVFPGVSVATPDGPPPAPPSPPAHPDPKPESYTRTVKGLLSVSSEKAVEEARTKLESMVADWLEPQGVSRSWRPSADQLDGMILATEVVPAKKEYGVDLYEASLRVNVSPEQRASFVESYNRHLVHWRMITLGGGLAFLLTCLAGVSGYIKADEATKGYYTNRLRVAAAAGVGAAGVLIYQMLV